MTSSSPGIRGSGSAVAAEMNADIRNVKADYKFESRRLSHDADRATRMDRAARPDVAKLHDGNGGVNRDYAADDGRASRSVVCYRNGEECVFRKGSIVCYSENCAAITDENLNEPTTLRLKQDLSGDDERSSSLSGRQKRSFGTTHEESLLNIFKQAAVPFFLGGLGTVFAGLILDTVQFWPPFQHVTELFIVVPPLLGLKGNLEMTLAARLSTQANLGNMDTPRQVWDIALGNMALVQCQACVLSLLSSVFAIVMGLASDDAFRLDQALFVAASSMATAAVASFLLGTVMVLVVAYSGRCRINPDNVATSVVDALGDMTTLAILAGFSTLLYGHIASVATSLTLLSPTSADWPCFNPSSMESTATWRPSTPAGCRRCSPSAPSSAGIRRTTSATASTRSRDSADALTVLLYLARCGAYWMWRRKIDPDNALIPLLTGFGDLCGTGLLLLAFLFLENIEDPSVAGFVGHHASPLAANDTILAAS
ncbi:uncharacterized protein LOC119462597 isoform X4 [Dermacentor silvarum]|uniref:uncharacterized protein LOC119462597 isoform X4 n=1 Tax=Dermacentor silvarum TaxID=543639 RepID=UPI0021016463|nr:uncharacterized protein LOC119462597 isoform X4 [Dermacentor silvarum]